MGKRTKGRNSKRALKLVMELMEIPGVSGQEGAVAEFVWSKLLEAGVDPAHIKTDSAHRRTPTPGEIGNLVVKLPGTVRAPRRMFSAHLDTVPTCVGAKPKLDKGMVRSALPDRGIGADNRAGVAVLLNTIQEIKTQDLPHPPLTFCWFVQEEVGLHGSAYVTKSLLGKPTMAFNFDGGSPAKLTIGATGGYRMDIDVHGIASHAGGAPEQGVSAIAIASLAIADLHRNGWHGSIRKGSNRGTSNIGIIQGGNATNVVTDHVLVKVEARSHDARFRKWIVKEIERAFRKAAKAVKNVSKRSGSVEFHGRLDYEAFRLSEDELAVELARDAVEMEGMEPELAIANGGLDANWLYQHGIAAVSLGCGQVNQHMVSEALCVDDFDGACRVALQLASSGQEE